MKKRMKKQKSQARFFPVLLCILMLSLLFAGCAKSDDDQVIYKKVSDLEGKTIGITTGTNYAEIAEETWDDVEILSFSDFGSLIPALASGKIDGFIADEPWLTYMMAENSDVTYINQKLSTEDYALVFARTEEGTALRDDFNAFLSEQTDLETMLKKMMKVWCDPDAGNHPVLDFDALSAENGTLRLCTDAENPPFEYLEREQVVGYEIELIYRYCQSRGYGLQVDNMTFDSLIPGVVTGKYDLACNSFAVTEERAEEVAFSDTVYSAGPVVAIYKENSIEGANTSTASLMLKITESFDKTFIRENRWKLFVGGIEITLLIAALSLLFGSMLGFGTYLGYRKGGRIYAKISGVISWFITGIPEVLFLLILYYIVFGNTKLSGITVSVIAFTIITGVNVFEMVKGGVESVDHGQLEAALALGYSERKAFFRVIFPQALPYIMPNYKAGIISLLKSTAIVGYLAVQDLTKVTDIIRSRTYDAFFPLIVSAAVYFVLAWILIRLVSILQKRILPFRRSSRKMLAGLDQGEAAEK